jgi:hypothetical protein
MDTNVEVKMFCFFFSFVLLMHVRVRRLTGKRVLLEGEIL